MKLTRLIALLLFSFGLLVANSSADAQVLSTSDLSKVKIDELSDAEIISYYQKAKSTGLSEDELFRLAEERGLPAAELTKLQNRLAVLTGGGVKVPKKDISKEEKDLSKMKEDSLPKVEKVKRDSTIFGTELFSVVSTVFEPNLRIATPGSYVLGPDDELLLNVFGYSEESYNLKVSAEGYVYINNVGPVLVNGLTVSQASERLKSKLSSTIYKAIKTGKTSISVTLSKLRTIQVTVIGQAMKPGTYSVSSLTTLFNLLYLCGGPSDRGSFRQIELIRDNKTYRKVDLYGFLLRGDRSDNVLLQEQDVVVIPYYENRVLMDGEVKRPGKFEMLGGESFDQLLTYSGGFTDSAYRSMVKVTRISDIGRTLSDIKAADFAGFQPRSGDNFFVSKAITRFLNRVSIQGAVLRPGDYELLPGMTLDSLIRKAGGLRSDAFLENGYISRLNKDLTPSSVTFEPRMVLEGKQAVPLKAEDVVTISSVFDLRDALTVEVSGEVRKPGTLLYRENTTLQDLLQQAGGFTERANKATVEISRRVRNAQIAQNDFQQSKIIVIDLSEGLGARSAKTIIEPFDIVVVRPSGSYQVQRSVYVAGEVLNPGQYVLEGSRETVSKLIERTGGFKGSADSSSVGIRRVNRAGINEEERQRILERLLNVDRDSILADPKLRETYLSKVDFLSANIEKIRLEPGGPEDLILEDGDIVEVARASSLVRVSGEVFHPTLLPFEKGNNAHDYIKRSGDFTTNARRSKTFVIYPDGRATSVKRFLFFKTYPSVKPRSEIYVPSRDKEGKKGMTTGEWVAISSILTALATLVVTVLNAK